MFLIDYGPEFVVMVGDGSSKSASFFEIVIGASSGGSLGGTTI